MDYINNNNSLKNDLKELSVFLGDNLDWVQGAGGKLPNGTDTWEIYDIRDSKELSRSSSELVRQWLN